MLFILIIVACLILQFFLPWWIIALASFVMAMLNGKSGKQAFWSGFFALLILWGTMSMIKSLPNEHLLAKRVGEMLHLPYWWLTVLVTAIIGALIAGICALCGYHFSKSFTPKKQN